MKKIYPTLLLSACLASTGLMAQSKNTPGARSLIEKGTKGDLIIANKIKKDQLKVLPEVLQQPGPARKKRVMQIVKTKTMFKNIRKTINKKGTENSAPLSSPK